MSKVREISVERVHLGEASDEEVEEVFGDPAATARLEELAEEDETFHHTHPRNEQLGAIQRRLHLVETRERWARRKRWMGVSAVLLPVVAAVGVLALQPTMERVEPEPLTTRAKGLRPSLVVHRQVSDGEEVLSGGAVAAQGDVLQLAYVPGEASHGVVLSIDGNGSVTLHHPASVGGDTRLQRGGESRLPHGYQLDDAPSFERFFLVTGAAPIDVSEVLAAADRLATGGQGLDGALDLPGKRVDDFVVRKGAR